MMTNPEPREKSTFNLGYLSHHGIKGQRWGVRRFQNEDGSYTQAGRERYGFGDVVDAREALTSLQNTKASLGRKIKRARVVGGILSVPTLGISSLISADVEVKAQKAINKIVDGEHDLRNKELTIKAGETFIRTSRQSDESDKKNMYVSLTGDKSTEDYYTKVWPGMVRSIQKDQNVKFHQNTFEAKTELRAPSYDDRKKIALGLVEADKKLYSELGSAYMMDQVRLYSGNLSLKKLSDLDKWTGLGSEYKSNAKAFAKELLDDFDTNYSRNSDNAFRMFTASIPTSPKLMKAYTDALRKEGYNLVFDDNANAPSAFIVFDTKSSFNQTGTRKLE